MHIEIVTVIHPNIVNREVSLLLVNNSIDIPSCEFLIYEARYGGRNGSIGGKSTHKAKAFQIAELYRYLNDINLTWDKATEFDIKRIRNAMLCWDSNNNIDDKYYDYNPIKNDSINHKLNTWFKFYKYMTKLGKQHDVILSVRKIKKYEYNNSMLSHLNYRTHNNDKPVEVWKLKVKPSPKTFSHHALSRTEFSKLRQHLRNIDIVYELFALFMVETGLRITAAVEAKEEDFKGVFKLFSSGKGLNDVVKRNYIPKGSDEYKQYDLPLRVMQEINESYLIREYNDRLYKYEKRSKRLAKTETKENPFWILKNGKLLEKHDIWKAFDICSNLMNRTTNKITPHWLRHTFATWTIMDIANVKNIPLENTGTTPNPLLILALQQKLGHADSETTLKYIVTALQLMKLDLNDGSVKISLRSFLRDKNSQSLVTREARSEFGDKFVETQFDLVKYALSRGIVIDDES
jgi:integrase